MPVYNTGEYLKTAVESILSQSLKEFELILVDDGSTDGSSERCDEYARQDSRVVVLHQKNGGICNARNAALKIAKGEYIAFSDHDDEYLPGLLEDNYNYCKQENLDFVKFCKKWDVVNGNEVTEHHENSIEKRIFERKDVITNIVTLMERRFGSCVWDTMFNHKFLTDNNISFDPFFKMGGEDYAFNFRCLECVNRFGTNDKVYYNHIIRNNFSTSSKFNPNCLEVSRQFMVNFLKLLDAHSISPEMMKDEYAFLYTMFYLSPQTQNIMCLHKDYYERKELLDGFRKETFWRDFIDSANFSWIRNKNYFVIHYLFKYKFYRLLFFLFDMLKK